MPDPVKEFETKSDFQEETACKNCKFCCLLSEKETDFHCVNEIIKEQLQDDIIHDLNEGLCNGKGFEKGNIPLIPRKERIRFPDLAIDPYTIANQYIKHYPFFFDSGRNWWRWNHEKFYWEIIDTTDILASLNKVSQIPNVTQKTRNELLEAFREIGRLNKPKDAKRTWIQFKNMIYDVETDKKFEANPKYFITNPIPWKLGEAKNTPIMDKLFEQWVGKDYVRLLYEIIAYCLLPDYPINRLFCLLGEGCGGKSSFQRLIEKFVGQNNVTATELDRLVASPRFEVTRLHKKLLCLIGETDFNSIGRSSVLKRLTGKDKIPMEYKHRGMFEDYNYAKILIATNNLPATDDKTEGWYRRWCIIDFPNKFDERKDILNEIPEEEYNNLALKSIDILKELIGRGEFTNEGTIEDRKKKYEEKSNPFDKFWNENVDDIDANTHIFTYEFKKRLDEWCKENRFRILSERTIARHMKDKGATAGRSYSDWQTGIKKQYRCWHGISWKNEIKKEEFKIVENEKISN